MGLHTDVAKQRPWKVINIQQLQVTLGERGASRKATKVFIKDLKWSSLLTYITRWKIEGCLVNWSPECPIISDKVMQDEQIASSVDAPFIQFGGQITNPSFFCFF